MASGLAVVLSGGGARGAYQVGVLNWLAEQYPELEIEIITGVSAGAINAAVLAGTRGGLAASAGRLKHEWEQLTPDRVFSVSAGKLLSGAVRGAWHFLTGTKMGSPAVRGWFDMSPLRSVLERCVDVAGIEENIRLGRMRALALSATSYDSGHTVTFIHDADGTSWTRARREGRSTSINVEHVAASAAIPLVFPAVRIGAEHFGDGSLRQTAPLAPAVHLGATKILAVSMRSAPEPSVPDDCYPSTAQIGGLLFNSLFLDALDADAEQLGRMNRLLEGLPPGSDTMGLRRVELELLRPSRDLGSLARGVDVSLDPLLNFVLRGIGGNRQRASDLLSYLMFHPAYTLPLMELGYADAGANSDDIRRFVET